jgi:hypothetical protein
MRTEAEVIADNPALVVQEGEESQISGNSMTEFFQVMLETLGLLHLIHLIPSFNEMYFFHIRGIDQRFFEKMSCLRFTKKVLVFPLNIQDLHNVVLFVHLEAQKIILFDSIENSAFKRHAFDYVLNVLFVVAYAEEKNLVAKSGVVLWVNHLIKLGASTAACSHV